eukprot:Nitzschia sp. Nitz4//scaffold8_size234185//8141//9175//NITZ4_001228-RA/size234185-processed-gene-0.250-mRNA-1//1//CDS//3329559719//7786//frame0
MSSDTQPTGSGALQNPLSNAPQTIQWKKTIELGYDEPSEPPIRCFGCGKPSADLNVEKLSKCSKCKVASYCSRDCQVQDWKQGRHKVACASYSRLAQMSLDPTKEAVRNEIFARVRFYACPYAVHKASKLGRGFLFLQSDTTLADLSISIPKDRFGFSLDNRSILMHFLTLGEYDTEVCRDDFEMAVMRPELNAMVDEYDEQKEVVLLTRFRCGHVAVGKAVLVPDYGICRKLGEDYYSNNEAGAVQLTLDDFTAKPPSTLKRTKYP